MRLEKEQAKERKILQSSDLSAVGREQNWFCSVHHFILCVFVYFNGNAEKILSSRVEDDITPFLTCCIFGPALWLPCELLEEW